ATLLSVLPSSTRMKRVVRPNRSRTASASSTAICAKWIADSASFRNGTMTSSCFALLATASRLEPIAFVTQGYCVLRVAARGEIRSFYLKTGLYHAFGGYLSDQSFSIDKQNALELSSRTGRMQHGT